MFVSEFNTKIEPLIYFMVRIVELLFIVKLLQRTIRVKITKFYHHITHKHKHTQYRPISTLISSEKAKSSNNNRPRKKRSKLNITYRVKCEKLAYINFRKKIENQLN